jgi:NSS family neurotransmitter:Na+ symporter
MANLLLPVVALLTAIFIGWFASNDAIREEMGLSDGLAFRTWRILMRFIVPIALTVILISGFIG